MSGKRQKRPPRKPKRIGIVNGYEIREGDTPEVIEALKKAGTRKETEFFREALTPKVPADES